VRSFLEAHRQHRLGVEVVQRQVTCNDLN
jgi:hypothetical protein